MPDSELDDLMARLLAESACSLSPATRLITLPELLPADLRQFFTRSGGGRLYSHPDYPTPQFGCTLSYSAEQPVTQLLPCDGPEFDWFYTIADFDTGAYEHAVVSAHPDTHGHIYHLRYSLGAPALTIADVQFLAPTFTRWLAMHVEAWDIYLHDWREGLNHFRRLIDHERHSQKTQVA